MKKIAALTMARNDLFFLERWISYYGKTLGEEHLYIFLDGEDQPIPSNIGKANLTILQHQPMSRAKGDKFRIHLLSSFAKKLFIEKKYDLVIGTDADEFLVVDPNCQQSLASYLSSITITKSLSALGIDVGQNTHTEASLDSTKSILSQRHFALLSSRYTKASVLAQPLAWGSGFHRVKNTNFTIDKNLYLFHIGYCDLDILAEKNNIDKIKNGWQKHLNRRAKTIHLTSTVTPKEGDKALATARKIQQYYRPIYAWNKPAMPCWINTVIHIPKRFQNIFI